MADKPLLTDDEIKALLSVEETDQRVAFRLTCPLLSVEIDGINLGVGESFADAFIRSFGLARIREIPVQSFCSTVLAQADKHGVDLTGTVVQKLHSLASAVPQDDRLAIDAVVDVIHDLVRSEFVLDAVVCDSQPEVLMGYSVADQTYTGNPRIIRYMAPRPRDTEE